MNGFLFTNSSNGLGATGPAGPAGATGPMGATGPSGSIGGLTGPTLQLFTSVGATNGALFAIAASGASAALGSVYLNNGATYLVKAAYNGTTYLFTSSLGLGIAITGGTLQLLSGSGSSGIGFASFQSLSTFSVNSSALYLEVELVGGGAGGGGSGNTSSTLGGNGQVSVFGTNAMIAGGGFGGYGAAQNGNGGFGGTASVGSLIGYVQTGQAGFPTSTGNAGTNLFGGNGGTSPFGGNGSGGLGSLSAATSGVLGTGSGGGGGGTSSSEGCAGGGGAGGYAKAIISSPGATYFYTIGNGGIAGSSGQSGFIGGTGGIGCLVIKTYFQ